MDLAAQEKSKQEAIKKYQADVKRLTETVEKNPNGPGGWGQLGDAYMGLEENDKALECFLKALDLEPKDVRRLSKVSMIYQSKNDLVNAHKYADLNLQYNPKEFLSNYVQVGLLMDAGKYAEAMPFNEECLKLYPLHSRCNLRKGDIYTVLGEKDKATEAYWNGTKKIYEDAISYCSRGQCYYKVGEKDKALADFKKAQEILHQSDDGMAPPQKAFMKSALETILGAEAISDQVEAEIKHLNTQGGSNAILKKFTANVQALKAKAKEVQSDAVYKMGKGEKAEMGSNVTELERLKEEFNRQMAEMKKEMAQMSNKVEKIDERVTAVENSLEKVKEDLDNKLDDFKKKLEKELDKQDLPADEKTKIKGYFKAFLETFSSGYVTAQVVASGQVQLDAGSSAATILSTLASFAPFCGSALESGIKTVGEFLKTKEMVTSARKMKGLAGDTSELSQMVGKVGYEIALNKDQQKRIVNISEEDLQRVSGNLFNKIMKFCDNLSEAVDSYLYSKLYKLPAERLGHNDANMLIEKWIKGQVTPYDIEKQFIQQLNKELNAGATEQKTSASTSPVAQVEGRTSCCNMF